MTIDGYTAVVRRYLSRELLETKLRDLRPQQINALYAHLLSDGRRRDRKRATGLSPATIQLVHAVLATSLRDAARSRMIDWNPAAAVAPPSRRRSPVFPTWSAAELKQFLLAMRDDRHYAAYHLAAFTGLRRGELLGLRWCDVDLQGSVIRVVQTLVRLANSDLHVGPPKTPRSRRVIAIDQQTVSVLTSHREHVERSRKDRIDEYDFVFTTGAGKPINPAVFSVRFRANVTSAGVRRIRFHDLRHTHATHALQAGIHPKIVSERLGHSSIEITLDTYSHVLPSMQAEAAETVAALCQLSPS
jgi:integrase